MRLKELDNLILIWGVLSKESLGLLKEETVLVPENRPFLYGLKHNIPLLRENNISFVYCTDNMIGYLFYRNKIKKTYLFYKEKTEKGLIGPCGSLYAGLLSRLHGVKVDAFLGAKVNFDNIDQDVSTLLGREFILFRDKERAENGPDELISAEVLL